MLAIRCKALVIVLNLHGDHLHVPTLQALVKLVGLDDAMLWVGSVPRLTVLVDWRATGIRASKVGLFSLEIHCDNFGQCEVNEEDECRTGAQSGPSRALYE